MSKKSKSYYHAIGNSTSQVTGSCHLIKHLDYNILLEYGSVQTNSPIDDYKTNKTKSKYLKAKQLNAIIIGHVHQDHIGLIPTLYKAGATCNLYVPTNTKKLLEIMFLDSVKIMNKEYELYKKSQRISMPPLYTEEDVYNTLNHVIECQFNKEIWINGDISFRYLSAHHIVNSAQVILYLCDENNIKKVGYTSDIGSSKLDKRYLMPLKPIEQVDLLIAECTYSDHKCIHRIKDIQTDIDKLKTIVGQIQEYNSKLLIPVFSLNRLEDILSVLYDIFYDNLDIDIVVDTPLGIKIADIWEEIIPNEQQEYWDKVWNWDKLKKVNSHEDSIVYQEDKKPMIILASSGMMQSGRSIMWAKKLLPDCRNHICFCGFTGENSLAWQIKNKVKYPIVNIEGKKLSNNIQITVLNSFSSHADFEDLLKYYSQINYNKIVLVHSEEKSKLKFADDLRNELSKVDKTSKVICSVKDMKIDI